MDLDPDQGLRHEVRRQLDLVATIGCYAREESLSLLVPRRAYRQVQNCLRRSKLDLSCPWIVIHPGASAESRRYEPENFTLAARSLVQDHNIQVVFTGRAWEEALVQEIQSKMRAPSISLAGRLALDEFAALLALAPLLISNNTGPVHIAAALGTPVVDLYALTNPQHTPWRVPHRLLYSDVPCKFCFKSICPMVHHNCLRLVAPESVVQAAIELLNESSQPSPAEEVIV
jgi:ADP-heptose:LPS heptosyltransferase